MSSLWGTSLDTYKYKLRQCCGCLKWRIISTLVWTPEMDNDLLCVMISLSCSDPEDLSHDKKCEDALKEWDVQISERWHEENKNDAKNGYNARKYKCILYTGKKKKVKPNFRIFKIECYQKQIQIHAKSTTLTAKSIRVDAETTTLTAVREIFDEAKRNNNGRRGWTWESMKQLNFESLGKLVEAEFVMMNISKSKKKKKGKWKKFHVFNSTNAKDKMHELWVLSLAAASNGELRFYQALHFFIWNDSQKPLINIKKCKNYKHPHCKKKLFVKSTKLTVSKRSGKISKDNGTCCCGKVHYCTVHCQKVHWKIQHRNECLKRILKNK